MAFCLGAFQDAWILRRETRSAPTLAVRPSRSAVQCTAILFLLVFMSSAAALLLPNVRTTIQPWPYRDSRNIALISQAGVSVREVPSISMRQLRAWQGRTQQIFSEFAFYQPVRKPVRIASHYTRELNIARATSNLFPLLGVRAAYEVNKDAMPMLFVSETLWRSQFHSDRRLLGDIVEVGIYKARLGGIIMQEQ